jgi:hypothetical protein
MHSVRLPRRSALCAAILTLVSVVGPGRLCAQVIGTVVGPGEAPLPGATVMLWTGSSEVARSVTDEDGRFRFDSTLAARATSVVARRIGFRPTSRSLGAQEGRAGSGAAHRDVGHAAVMTWARGEVAARNVGEVDESRLRPGSYGYSGQSRRAGFLALDSAYADRLPPTKPGQWVANPEYFHWWYPKLHGSLIEHFLEDSFGARHALSASTHAGGGWHVVF